MYKGQTVTIPLGQLALRTDDGQDELPPNSLLVAEDIELRNGYIAKGRGARKWNNSALPAAVRALYDWHPTDVRQYFVAVGGNGKVYRLPDAETQTEITATGSAPSALSLFRRPQIVQGGNEVASNPRKLFIFSGGSQIQVISGDSSTRANIANPATDWATSRYPNLGVMHRNRLFVFRDHFAYASSVTDHENFSSPLLFSVFPGDSEEIKAAFVFRGKLFVFKRPRGAYILNDEDPDTDNWYFQRLTTGFGIASEASAVEMLNDLVAGNTSGSLTSLAATDTFGDVDFGDVLEQLRCSRGIVQANAGRNFEEMAAIYHSTERRALFSYQLQSGIANNAVIELDVANPQTPKITLSKRFQANVFALRRDFANVERVYYGANDGYIYEMDREDRNVGGVAFNAVFQTPHWDFSHINPEFKNVVKRFDFLSVNFNPTNDNDATVDVFIDGLFQESISFRQTKGAFMGSGGSFLMPDQQLTSAAPRELRKPLHGIGRRISFRVRNAGLDETFEIPSLTVYFRPLGYRQEAVSKGN